jgi:ClpP class serine protease
MHNLISAINSGVWFISPEHATGYLPVAVSFLLGKPNPFVENLSENRELQRPYFVAAAKPFNIKDFGEGHMTNPDNAPHNSIAIIPVQGVVTADDQFSGSSGSKTKMSVLDKIKSNDNIIGAIFDFDTPGGEGASTRQFSKAIKDLGKPTVGFVRNMSASAGYWLASACDTIILEDEISEVGSIGAYRTMADFTRYFQNQGVDIKTVYAKQSTKKNSTIKRDDDTTEAKEEVSEFAQIFIDDIKDNRGEKLGDDPNILKGKMYRGQKAIDAGLADSIGSIKDAFSFITGSSKQIIDSKSNNTTTKNQDTMKIKDTWAAITGFFGSEKKELVEEDVEKLNTELGDRQTKIDQLTADLAAEKTAHEATQTTLTAETQKVTDLTAEKATLETELAKKPAKPAASVEANDEIDTEEIPMDVADEAVKEI